MRWSQLTIPTDIGCETTFARNSKKTGRISAPVAVKLLTAMGAHERPLFNGLRGTVVSRRVFIRSQSLIAR